MGPALGGTVHAQGVAGGDFTQIIVTPSQQNSTGPILPAADNHNVISGSGSVVGSDIHHPNGNIYDQVLMTGPSVTVIADPGQVVRTSFIDDNDDIVQVEFSGTGSVTITLDSATYQPPAAPVKYLQPGVSYVKGHATVHVQGAAADTYLAIFSVGRGNAVNQALFPVGMTYDGMADLQLVRVDGADLGAIFAGNVRFTSSDNATGIEASGTRVHYRVIVGDIRASATASPLLRIGSGSSLDWDAGAVLVAGGDLTQSNGAPIDISSVSGQPLAQLNAVAGTLSDGTQLPPGNISAQFSSLLPGTITINNRAYSTHTLLPASFNDLLNESGLNTLVFGDVSIAFSDGNSGTFIMEEATAIDGDFVNLELTGTFSYAVSGPYQNVMTLTLNLGNISISDSYGWVTGTPQQLAQDANSPMPTRMTAVAELDSSISGTASMTIDYTSGPSDFTSDYFNLDHNLDFWLF